MSVVHGSQEVSQFTHYDHNNVNLYYGFRYPLNGPHNNYIHNAEAFSSSIWLPNYDNNAHLNQPEVPPPSYINQNGSFREITYYAPHMCMTVDSPSLAQRVVGQKIENAHGSQNFSQFTHNDFSEIDRNNANLYHGYRYPPNGLYNRCIHNPPILQNHEALLSSIWVPKCAYSRISQPRYPTVPFTYYAPHKRMTIHFPRIPKEGEIFCALLVDNVLFLDFISRLYPGHRHSRNRALYRVHGTNDGFLLRRTGDYVLACPEENKTFTCYEPGYDIVMHFTKIPADGDIFRSQQNDNVITLEMVPTEKAQEEYHSQYPWERNLYHVNTVVREGKVLYDVHRMSDDILVFHEENRTATYYLPKKDIVFHFTRVPRDGDIFCSQRSDKVVILDPHKICTFFDPWGRDLYRVHEGNGGFLLVKINDNSMAPSEESYFLGEESTTFTCYLKHMDMAFHFTSVPTPGDFFLSHLKNNIMILDIMHGNANEYNNRFYGIPFNEEDYFVRQRDAGFELVKMMKDEKMNLTPEATYRYCLRLRLKIKRYITSSWSSDNGDNICSVCLDAYKDFDRIGILQCGHTYHVNCIVTWLRKKESCPVCRGEALPLTDQNFPHDLNLSV